MLEAEEGPIPRTETSSFIPGLRCSPCCPRLSCGRQTGGHQRSGALTKPPAATWLRVCFRPCAGLKTRPPTEAASWGDRCELESDNVFDTIRNGINRINNDLSLYQLVFVGRKIHAKERITTCDSIELGVGHFVNLNIVVHVDLLGLPPRDDRRAATGSSR